MATSSFNSPSPLGYRNIVRNHNSNNNSKKKVNYNNNENIDPCILSPSLSSNTPNKNNINSLLSPSSLTSKSFIKSKGNSIRGTPSTSSSEKKAIYGVVRRPLKEKNKNCLKENLTFSASSLLLSSSSSSKSKKESIKEIECNNEIDKSNNISVTKSDNVTEQKKFNVIDYNIANIDVNSKLIKLQQSTKEKDGLIHLLKGTVIRKKKMLFNSQQEATVLSEKLRQSHEQVVVLQREVDKLKNNDITTVKKEYATTSTSPIVSNKPVSVVDEKATNTSFISSIVNDEEELEELSAQLAIQRRYNERLEDQMRSLVESQFTANLMMAEQDIADRFLRKLLNSNDNNSSNNNNSNEIKANATPKGDDVPSKIQSTAVKGKDTAAAHDSDNNNDETTIPTSSPSPPSASFSPKLLKELFAGLDNLHSRINIAPPVVAIVRGGGGATTTRTKTKENDTNSTADNIFDSAPDYGQDMYSDLSDDDSLGEVFASLNEVYSFASETKTINTVGAVVASKYSGCVCEREKKGDVPIIIDNEMKRTYNGNYNNSNNSNSNSNSNNNSSKAVDQKHIHASQSLSILSPSSFREHMLQIKRDNESIKDDIARFRSTLRELQNETTDIYKSNNCNYNYNYSNIPPRSARL